MSNLKLHIIPFISQSAVLVHILLLCLEMECSLPTTSSLSLDSMTRARSWEDSKPTHACSKQLSSINTVFILTLGGRLFLNGVTKLCYERLHMQRRKWKLLTSASMTTGSWGQMQLQDPRKQLDHRYSIYSL
jgi:hypothetical protein